MDIYEKLKELRKVNKKRNFLQSVDIIINLKNFDYKKEKINFYVELPHGKGKENKVLFITEKKLEDVSKELAIEWGEVEKMSIKEFKKLESKYEYIATTPKIVPLLAKKFGKVLGPRKKMPDPKLGCIIKDINMDIIKKMNEKLEKTIKVKNDGNSIKLVIGKEDMEDKKINENFLALYSKLIDELPKGESNIKNILIKFTMSKSVKIK